MLCLTGGLTSRGILPGPHWHPRRVSSVPAVTDASRRGLNLQLVAQVASIYQSQRIHLGRVYSYLPLPDHSISVIHYHYTLYVRNWLKSLQHLFSEFKEPISRVLIFLKVTEKCLKHNRHSSFFSGVNDELRRTYSNEETISISYLGMDKMSGSISKSVSWSLL